MSTNWAHSRRVHTALVVTMTTLLILMELLAITYMTVSIMHAHAHEVSTHAE